MFHCAGAFAVKSKNSGKILCFSGFFRRKTIFVSVKGNFKSGRCGNIGFNRSNKTAEFGIGTGFQIRNKFFGIFGTEKSGDHILIENIAVTFEQKRNSVTSDSVSVKLKTCGNFGDYGRKAGFFKKIAEKIFGMPAGKVGMGIHNVKCGALGFHFAQKIVARKLCRNLFSGGFGIFFCESH